MADFTLYTLVSSVSAVRDGKSFWREPPQNANHPVVRAIKIGKGQVSFSGLAFPCIKFTSDLFYQSHRGAEQFQWSPPLASFPCVVGDRHTSDRSSVFTPLKSPNEKKIRTPGLLLQQHESGEA